MFNAFVSDPNRPEHRPPIAPTDNRGNQGSDRRSMGRNHPYDNRRDRNSGGGYRNDRHSGGGRGHEDRRRQSGAGGRRESDVRHVADPRQIKSYVDLDGANGAKEPTLNYD
jgi:hypothetical protein